MNVRGQPVEILSILLERPGELVSREELRARLWSNSTFGDFDHSLNAAVNKLREALEDSAETRRFIETVPRRGYRFSAAVQAACTSPVSNDAQELPTHDRKSSHPHPDRRLAALALGIVISAAFLALGILTLRRPTTPAISSLVVLPFANLSGDPNQEYFADGLTETLITDLAQTGAIRVISRTTAMQYKATKKTLPEIAQQLHVEAVVEGSVQRSADRVRIDAKLIHAPSERPLWAQRYERDERDVLVLENEVARAIVQQIHGNIGQAPNRSSIAAIDPAVQEDYLRGLYYWSHRPLGLQKSIVYFQQALEKQPTYAPAYAGLALCYATMGSWENGALPPQETMPKAKAAALKALQLDDSLSQAHAALAYVYHHYDWNWAAAENEFHRSLQLNSNDPIAHHWYSHFLTAAGRNAESLAESKRAQELDPLDPSISIHLAWLYYYAHEYDKVIEQSKEVIEAAPESFWPHFDLGLAYEQKKMFQEAIKEFGIAKQMSPASTFVTAALGHTQAVAGEHEQALRALTELLERAKKTYVPAFDVAVVCAGIGDRKRTVDWLDRALTERSGWLLYLQYDPRFESLRSNSSLQYIARRVSPPTDK